MAQKQIIWSGYAKKKLYAVLESIIKEHGDTDQAMAFFKLLSKKIADLKKNMSPVYPTNSKDVMALPMDPFIILYEIRDSGLIIHTVIK
jgi:hypothetical protein